jgi:hypothetical protein
MVVDVGPIRIAPLESTLDSPYNTVQPSGQDASMHVGIVSMFSGVGHSYWSAWSARNCGTGARLKSSPDE